MTLQNKNALVAGTTGIGNVAGLVLGFHRQSGFWGGLGWVLVGGFAGASLGYVVTSMLPETPGGMDSSTAVVYVK